MKFERKRLIDNIYRVAKENDIKIGTLEENAQVSTGYLSRLAKDGDKGSFSVDLLCSAAEQLDKSLDYLVYSDIEALTDNERYMIDFMDKLIIKTESLDMEWKMMPPAITDTTYIFEHPLFKKTEHMDNDFHDTPYFYELNEYFSRFLEFGTARIAGNCYHVMFDDYSRTEIYLMSVTQMSQGYMTREEDIIKEIYFIQHNNVEGIACSKFVCEAVKNSMDRLYKAVEDSRSHLVIDSDARSAIDRFMNK